MISRDSSPSSDPAVLFDELLAEVMDSASHFGHREHIHLTWLAVRPRGVAAAIDLVSAGIQRTARYSGGRRNITRR